MRPIAVIGTRAILAVVLGVGVLATACGGPESAGTQNAHVVGGVGHCPSSFALSLVSDDGGAATPLAAAVWFAKHGGVSVPRTGWHQIGHSHAAVVVASRASTLHVVEGPDHRWQVDSGHNCG